MVAGDTKRIIVIKNISSNLIEEAILILKNDKSSKDCNETEKQAQRRLGARNDLILKEAESIINQYIKDNGLTRPKNRHLKMNKKMTRINIPVNVVINTLLMAAIAFLLLVVGRFFE